MRLNQFGTEENEPDEVIVEKILSDSKPREGVGSTDQAQVALFTYGGRSIEVKTELGGDVFEILYLENIAGAEHKPHETTLLHAAVKEYVQRIVDKRGTPSRFQTRTDNDSVLGWLRGPGQRMFNWQPEFLSQPSSHEHLTVFYTYIFPRKPEKPAEV